jgi:hypothetical protein
MRVVRCLKHGVNVFFPICWIPGCEMSVGIPSLVLDDMENKALGDSFRPVMVGGGRGGGELPICTGVIGYTTEQTESRRERQTVVFKEYHQAQRTEPQQEICVCHKMTWEKTAPTITFCKDDSLFSVCNLSGLWGRYNFSLQKGLEWLSTLVTSWSDDDLLIDEKNNILSFLVIPSTVSLSPSVIHPKKFAY